MLIKGEYNLKFGPRHDESPREVLNFAMFKQEDTFRKQVCELHRAKLVPVEKTFCQIPVAYAGHRGISIGFQQNLSSPRGCLSRYISDKGGNPLVKGYYCCSSTQPTEKYHFLDDEAAAFSFEEVDLSLSIGRNNQKEPGSNKAWESNKTCTNEGVKSNPSLTNGLSRNESKENQIRHSNNVGGLVKPFPFRDGALLDLNIPLLDESSVSGKSISDSEDISIITKEPETHLRNSSSEVDDQTQDGASNLIYFMSECIREQYFTNKSEQHECCDSFEANVLKLTECSVEDDLCVSSKPFEVNATHKKEYGINLRRGRRMKDFRKDILPSLASLSRHEISEDMHLMDTILRSREYKKNISKMKGRENQFKTVRSRRSR